MGVGWGKLVKQEADGRVPNEAGSTVQRATPDPHPTANCAEHKGLMSRKQMLVHKIAVYFYSTYLQAKEEMSFCDE